MDVSSLKFMIYHFKITTQESPEFLLEIDMDLNHNFFQFHQAIQKPSGFQPHQLASFFILDKVHRKEVEVSMLDLGVNGSAYYIMQKTKISELLDESGQKLIYTFDFINDRSLLIELTDIIMEKNLNEPHVALLAGDAPIQILEELEEQKTGASLNEPVYHDYGILDDYAQIFGEMEDF